MTVPEPPVLCAAEGRGCGTPTGWRNGGRCLRCRHARNEESKNRTNPPLSRDERARVIDALNGGATPDEAAAEVGRGGRSLYHYATRDRELYAALAGEDRDAQQRARVGDYVAALIRHRGDQEAAAKEIGADSSETSEWEAWADAVRRAGQRVEFTRLWNAGVTNREIADRLGWTDPSTASVAARRYGLPKRRDAYPPAAQRDDREAEFTALWHSGVTTAEIAEHFGWSSPAVASATAKRFGLKPRLRNRKFTQEQKRLFVELWQSGTRTAEIAERFGWSSPAIAGQMAKRFGLEPRLRQTKLTEDEEKLFAELWARGSSTAEIAERFGFFSESAVRSRAQALGLPRRYVAPKDGS